MKYIINGKFLTQQLTGVQRYAVEVTLEFIKLERNIIIATPKLNSKILEAILPFHQEIGNRQGVAWEQLDLPRFVKKQKATLINLTNSAPLFLKNSLVTIHDLGVYKNPKWYHWKFVYWYKLMIPKIIKNASLILTVSETSKKDIMLKFNVPSSKILVTYNGVSSNFTLENGILEKENIVLHVGSFSKRKNTEMLANAFIEGNFKDYKLIFVGKIDPNLSSEKILQHPSLEFLTHVKDAELNALYQRSKYIVSASSYEGFGLPVLEGLIHQCWAVISSIPVHKELFQQGVLFFDPSNELDLSLKLSEAINKSNQVTPMMVEQYRNLYSYRKSTLLIWRALQNLKVKK